MHPSSIENMRLARDRYLGHLGDLRPLRILDVGGRGLTGDRSYRPVFEHWQPNYSVADIQDGLGVTHVMPGPYTLPFDDAVFDLVVSGQMLEHCGNPFRSVAEMRRVMRPGASIVIIAPSSGPRHDTQDCWRFQEDAFRCIAEEVGLETVADWIDRSAPDQRSRQWADHVFVGRRPSQEP